MSSLTTKHGGPLSVATCRCDQEHLEDLRKFHGMDLVFEARMRFLEMPPEQREKLAPGWVDTDEPLWQQGGVALSALIEEHSDVPVLLPVPDCSLPRLHTSFGWDSLRSHTICPLASIDS